MSTASLRDVAVKLNREKLSQKKKSPTERTLLFIGSKNSGKTSLIQQLIEKDRDATHLSSTYLLEYKYARKSGKTLAKDVCHIWELGCGTMFTSLLSLFGCRRYLCALCVVLVIDLSLPEILLDTVEVFIDHFNSAFNESSSGNEDVQQRSINILEEEDKSYLKPFPVPFVIVGGKYDLFQNMEPTKKRVVCQYLRCLAHILQADLLFYSNNDTVTIKKTRDILSHYGFGLSEAKSSTVIDYNKPLRIFAGCDSFRSIQDSTASATIYSLEKYRDALLIYSNLQKSNDKQITEDPASDPNFEESTIDNLCKQKTEELKRMKERILATRMTNANSRVLY